MATNRGGRGDDFMQIILSYSHLLIYRGWEGGLKVLLEPVVFLPAKRLPGPLRMAKGHGGGCRHLGSLPNERRLNEATLVGTPRVAIGAFKTTDLPHWLCLTCFRSFNNRQTFLQHGRSAGHSLAWASREKDEPGEYIFCVNCKRPIRIDELVIKEREQVSAFVVTIKELLKRDPTNGATDITDGGHKNGKRHQTDRAPFVLPNGRTLAALAASRQRPPGLHNLGNTCFMNASLQCLASLDSLLWGERDRCGALSTALYDLLQCLRDGTGTAVEVNPLTRTKGKASSIGSSSLKSRSRSKSSMGALNPNHFFDQLGHKYSFFEHNEQQDSHDFLRLLFNALDDEITDAGGQLAAAPHRRCLEGSTIVRVQCARCRQVTQKREDSLDVSLSLSDVKTKALPSLEASLGSLSLMATDRKSDPNSGCTIPLLIENWRQPQLLTEDDAFACECCYRSIGARGDALPPGVNSIDHTHRVAYTTASCQYSMERLPRCLLLHLQRFSLHPSPARRRGGNRQQAHFSYGKNHRDVILPLYLNPALLSVGGGAGAFEGNVSERRYRLKAAVIHEGGTADSGHYVCLVHRCEYNSTNGTGEEDLENNAHGQDDDDNTNAESNPKDGHVLENDNDDLNSTSLPPPQNQTGRWYRISDSSVTPIPQDTVLSVRNAYMVFYELEYTGNSERPETTIIDKTNCK